jgi:hypothetical protein
MRNRKKVWMTIASVGSSLACVAAQAGTLLADFNSGAPAGSTLYENAVVGPSGGVGGTGVLELTSAQNSQFGFFYLPVLDAGVVSSFSMTFMAYVGGGTCCETSSGGTTADGFSVNFASNLPIPPGFSTAEEGLGTGLSINFDTWNNELPATPEAPAIEVKVGGALISRVFTQVSQGAAVVTPNYWPVSIVLDADGTIDVSYNGSSIFTNLATGYVPTVGSRFGFGARTGGANDNHWIDDLSITTRVGATIPEPATLALFGLGLAGIGVMRRKKLAA